MRKNQEPKSELEVEMHALFEETFKKAKEKSDPDILRKAGFCFTRNPGFISDNREFLLLVDPDTKKNVAQICEEIEIPDLLVKIARTEGYIKGEESVSEGVGMHLTMLYWQNKEMFNRTVSILSLDIPNSLEMLKFKDPTPFLERVTSDLKYLSS